MVDNSSDSGYELVLDNRRLIISFIVLILICCCFFVLGFVEGKRQGSQVDSLVAAESAAKQTPDVSKETERPSTSTAHSETPAVKEDVENQQLNWYKNVSGQEQKNEITAAPVKPAPASRKEPSESTTISAPIEPAPISKKEPAKSAAVSAPVTTSGYTVQVGAFRQRQQVEAKAKLLRSKGFDCRIEVPQSSEDLYLLKVGRFKSKAEAVAMELRLKKNGFGSFVKTN